MKQLAYLFVCFIFIFVSVKSLTVYGERKGKELESKRELKSSSPKYEIYIISASKEYDLWRLKYKFKKISPEKGDWVYMEQLIDDSQLKMYAPGKTYIKNQRGPGWTD